MDTVSDTAYALTKLRGLLGNADPEKLAYFVHDGAPVSKARARWNQKQHRFYTPGETATAQTALAWRFQSSVQNRPWTGNIAIVAIFYRPNRQRIDSDNLMKLVLDAGTHAGVWRDDCQVSAQASFVELDAARPRTVVALAPTDSSMDRDAVAQYTCTRCHVLFERRRLFPKQRPPRFCSTKCARATERREARCAKCEKIFQRRTAGQRYCSRVCSRSSPLVRQKCRNQRPWPKCQTCGGRVSRREYRQCSNCAPKGRKITRTKRRISSPVQLKLLDK
jgi:Holliday junction resolvase RusA-like endonuclease